MRWKGTDHTSRVRRWHPEEFQVAELHTQLLQGDALSNNFVSDRLQAVWRRAQEPSPLQKRGRRMRPCNGMFPSRVATRDPSLKHLVMPCRRACAFKRCAPAESTRYHPVHDTNTRLGDGSILTIRRERASLGCSFEPENTGGWKSMEEKLFRVIVTAERTVKGTAVDRCMCVLGCPAHQSLLSTVFKRAIF